MYWMSFIEMTEILMMNLHALRTQNWEEFKGSLHLMLPWMQIYDNDKYGKWMVEYWLELNNLPEETALYMKEGLFAQSMTGKPYSCLPLDMWIEMTMNKGSKLKAGWLKILKNEKVLLTDSRNVNSVNRVRSAMHDLANCTTSKQKHSENTATRLKQDEQAVQDIDNCITEFGCDPFNLEKPQLRSLQSGVLASTALVDDFESAHKAGEKLFEKFCNDRMLSDKSSFYSTVHRNSRRNFSNPPPVTGQTNMTITKTEAMENNAMSSIVALAEAHDEKFNLVDVMDYRVTDECLPIFNINGTMRKTQKSKLVTKFHMQPIDPLPIGYIAILDMGLIWYLATPSLEDRQRSDGTSFTWKDYASKMFTLITMRHRHASEIVLVNDRYDLPFTIKDSERNLRSGNSPGSKNVFIRAADKFPSPKDFQDFMRNPANKERLQKFLQTEFNLLCRVYPNTKFVYSVGPKCCTIPDGNQCGNYECDHIEADTVIFFVYSRIRRSGIQTLVVIDAEDTDILVVSAYVANTIEGDLAIKRKQEIIDCRILCPKEIADIIIPLHIHSGCDTTAAFFAHGKTTIYDKASASEDARVILRSVGKSLPVPQVVLDEMAKFTIKFVYNDKRSQTLGDARARKWTEMKKTEINNPPPSPINHGWTLDNGLCIPVRYTEPALPRYLSEVRQHHLRIGVDTGLGESDSDGDSDSDDDDDDDDDDDNGYE
ncbi:hypothetical protein GQR58_019910 [Nymphon striatum]|nr:hypothetical protein GQR58_019910 [Nymphon striatum]